jgi:hypothetical protein
LKPEQEELEQKQSELVELEVKLAQRELDLITLHSELHAFERYYHQIIGMRFTEIDYIEAKITECEEFLNSTDYLQSAGNIKKLYRALAKQIHPDLVTDKSERERRIKLMMAVNNAYEKGDEERLREIMYKWEKRTELIRTTQKISQSRNQIKTVEEEMITLQQTELNQLRIQVVETQALGQDLLQSMVLQLDKQIIDSQKRLRELKMQIGM